MRKNLLFVYMQKKQRHRLAGLPHRLINAFEFCNLDSIIISVVSIFRVFLVQDFAPFYFRCPLNFHSRETGPPPPRGFGDLGRRAIYFQGAGEH